MFSEIAACSDLKCWLCFANRSSKQNIWFENRQRDLSPMNLRCSLIQFMHKNAWLWIWKEAIWGGVKKLSSTKWLKTLLFYSFHYLVGPCYRSRVENLAKKNKKHAVISVYLDIMYKVVLWRSSTHIVLRKTKQKGNSLEAAAMMKKTGDEAEGGRGEDDKIFFGSDKD